MRPSRVRERSVFARPGGLGLWVCAVVCFGALALFVRTGVWAGGDSRPSSSEGVDLAALERAFERVITDVSPSVVGIRAARTEGAGLLGVVPEDGVVTFGRLVFVNGTGTIIRADGAILTNEHVVRGATDITVTLADGRTYSAELVNGDARSDLAVLHIDADGLQPARMCDWSRVARGQWSIALGNPFGLGNDGRLCASIGVIANLGRALPGLGEVDDRLYADMIQTTAAIYPGSSGGPLFSARGELLGVVTAVHARAIDDEGVGFAIPMTPAKRRVVAQLLDGEPVTHGYLGLTVVAASLADQPDLAWVGGGVVVESVEPDGPAALAGIQPGDFLMRYQAQPVTGPMILAELVSHTPVGTPVEIELRRGGRPQLVVAQVELRTTDRVEWMRAGAALWRGLRLADLTPEARARMHVDAGATGVAVIGVAPDSPAEQAEFEPGDVIERANGEDVDTVATFLKLVRGRRGDVRLSVRGRGEVPVPP